MNLQSRHVDAVLRHDRRDVAHEPLAIPGFDLDRDWIEMRRLGVPVDGDHPIAVLRVDGVDAVGAVDGDALATRGVSDNCVARDWLAARRHRRQDSLLSTYEHTRRGL